MRLRLSHGTSTMFSTNWLCQGCQIDIWMQSQAIPEKKAKQISIHFSYITRKAPDACHYYPPHWNEWNIWHKPCAMWSFLSFLEMQWSLCNICLKAVVLPWLSQFKIIIGFTFDKPSNVSLTDGSLHLTWLRVSCSIDVHLSLTFLISRWASALLFCCRILLHSVKNLTPKSSWLIFFSVFWHRTVCSEDSSDVRIFVGTFHEVSALVCCKRLFSLSNSYTTAVANSKNK
jgi:hypothetical protein